MTLPMPAEVHRLMTEVAVDRIEALEEIALAHEQVEVPTTEHFINGMYGREIVIPAGTMITGRVYKEGYLDIMLSGDISVATPQGLKRLTGCHVMESPPGRKRAGYAHAETRWVTVHRTDQFEPGDMLDRLTFFSRGEYREFLQRRDRESYQAVIATSGMSEEQVQAQVQNPDDQMPLPDEYTANVTVGPSMIHGEGLLACRDFAIGDHIGPGRIAGLRTPIGRYTNHSAYPNAVMQPLDNGDVALVATRLIQAGDEITTHYAVTLSTMQEALCQE